MKYILIPIFGGITLYDVFTTITGTMGILEKQGDLVIPVLFGLIVLACLLLSARLFEGYYSGFGQLVLGICWLSALIYDLYTSYIGNILHVAGGQIQNDGQYLIVVLMTIITTGSPILLSYFISEEI